MTPKNLLRGLNSLNMKVLPLSPYFRKSMDLMQTLDKVDRNEKIILLKSKRQRTPQGPKDSSIFQIQDHNKRDISRKKKKEKRV